VGLIAVGTATVDMTRDQEAHQLATVTSQGGVGDREKAGPQQGLMKVIAEELATAMIAERMVEVTGEDLVLVVVSPEDKSIAGKAMLIRILARVDQAAEV
jgi:hypothetical protein